MDFTPTNRPKEISDDIAAVLYRMASETGRPEQERADLMFASGYILGQAVLIRRSNASGQKAAS